MCGLSHSWRDCIDLFFTSVIALQGCGPDDYLWGDSESAGCVLGGRTECNEPSPWLTPPSPHQHLLSLGR